MCVHKTFVCALSNDHHSNPTSTSHCAKHIVLQTAWQCS